jgi:diguanylate cyclase (GGDEF)-like protein
MSVNELESSLIVYALSHHSAAVVILSGVVLKGLISSDIAASVVDSLTSSICIVDLAGTIVGVNRAWMEFNATNGGTSDDGYVGANYLDVCGRSQGDTAQNAESLCSGLRRVLEGQEEVFQIEYPCHSPAELRWFLARITPLARRAGADRGERIGAVVSHMDITDRKKLELEYARLAWTDPLTQLPNRRFFETYAAIELQRLQRFGGAMSVLALDLDNFKLINDGYGHPAGDAVLKEFAARCKATLRGSDLLVRIGLEEFVALLGGADEHSAAQLAERLRVAIEGMSVLIDGAIIRVTTSIGVASATGGDRLVSDIIARADRALYAAKNAGRNIVQLAA